MNGTGQRAPTEIVIDFSESLEPGLSTLEVRDKKGVRVDNGDSHLQPVNAKRLSVSLKQLPPGTYSVSWQVTSVDAHRTKGTYKFTIAP